MAARYSLFILLAAGLWAAPATPPAARVTSNDPRLTKAFRRPEQNGWIFVHLEGSPSEIGFQHGYLLAPEIEDAQRVVALGLTHDSHKTYAFFRAAAEKVLWPHIEQQYREELQGIAEGLKARGVALDLWDVVALNAWLELSPYYSSWYDKQHQVAAWKRPVPEHCSAFVATGSYTKDGKIVIAHNNWTEYKEGSRWNVIFDIVPSAGYRVLMDGMPGLIHSGDDFGINSAGIAITETTIGYFQGFDPNGIPEFVRARKAMQYSASIDDFARIMEDGNNGGYANAWLVADTRNNEAGDLELGLKHVTLKRTKDGYFVGSNFPENPELIRDEASDYPAHDNSISSNARHVRWEELMRENKGVIDVAAAQRFLSDHYDTFDKKTEPDERTLCGHIDLSPRGSMPWQPAYGPAGTVQNKAADAAMIAHMSFTAAMGHADGIDFHAGEEIKDHPEFSWEKTVLRDLDSHPWTTFQTAQ
ncbi:MAG TPA: C45 family peptidase [Bryobacteraceae bacterium]|nr:C45 family peptidase [Bryobacteraceae bacterium]